MYEFSKDEFEVPGLVRFETGNGGLTRIVVTSPWAGAEIYLQGAHVTRYEPVGQSPLLWMSRSSWFERGKPIRGGVPICFPWFGPRAGDPKAPGHGFARLREWTVESVTAAPDGTSVTICLALESDEATRAMWPADFRMRHTITVGQSLAMKLEVTNRSREPVRFEEALHTYLTVSDVRQIWIDGLGGGTKYIDKVDGAKVKEQSDPQIRFSGETDRVYLDTQGTCVVHDPGLRRRIEIAKSGSNATVVWNPWIAKARAMPDYGDDEWPGMVCVETVNAAQHVVELQPGATHAMEARVGLQG